MASLPAETLPKEVCTMYILKARQAIWQSGNILQSLPILSTAPEKGSETLLHLEKSDKQ